MISLSLEYNGRGLTVDAEPSDFEEELLEQIKIRFPKLWKNNDEDVSEILDILNDCSFSVHWNDYPVNDLSLCNILDFANAVEDIDSLETMYSSLDGTEGIGVSEYYNFDEDFFNTVYEDNSYEAARATHFGDVTWSDAYVKVNAYGNLETTDEIPYEDYSDEIIDRFISEKI